MNSDIILCSGVVKSAFAFISSTNSYGIISMWRSSRSSIESWISIFTTSSMQWSDPILSSCDIVSFQYEGMYLNGRIYWVADVPSVEHKSQRFRNVVCYDLLSNEFNAIELPHGHRSGSWRLSVDQNSIAAISIRGFGYESKTFEVFPKSERSNGDDGWDRIFCISPIISMFHYIGLYEGKCVFTNSFYKKHDTRRNSARHLMFIGEDMIPWFTELHGPMEFKYPIRSLFSFRLSLNSFWH